MYTELSSWVPHIHKKGGYWITYWWSCCQSLTIPERSRYQTFCRYIDSTSWWAILSKANSIDLYYLIISVLPSRGETLPATCACASSRTKKRARACVLALKNGVHVLNEKFDFPLPWLWLPAWARGGIFGWAKGFEAKTTILTNTRERFQKQLQRSAHASHYKVNIRGSL